MPVMPNNNPMPGTAGTAIPIASAPTAGVNKVQTITIGGTPTAGTFTITFDGYTTAAITWSSTNSTLVSNIDTALEALPNVSNAAGGGATVAVGTATAGIGTFTITSTGNLAALNHSDFTVTSSLTGTSPTLAIATTTAGVTATGRGQGPGALFVDTTNAFEYINTGTALSPTLTKVGTQS
jgi:hypothetical protein